MRPGRPAVFRDKVKDVEHRVVGFLTADGRFAFELARGRLRAIYEKVMQNKISISDADTIEFLARGELETAKHLRAEKRNGGK